MRVDSKEPSINDVSTSRDPNVAFVLGGGEVKKLPKLCGRGRHLLWIGPKENLGFCAESEPGVDWDACAGDNGDGTLNLSRCKESGNYTDTCYDSVWDATR